MNNPKPLVVLLTGDDNHLSRAVASAYIKRGDLLAWAGNHTNTSKGITTNELHITTDLQKTVSINTMVNKVMTGYGHIDVLTNIAGVSAIKTRPSSKNELPFTNLHARSLFDRCKAVFPYMLDQRMGFIVNVLPQAASDQETVIKLTKIWAAEYRYHNIHINCILPSTIDTPQNRINQSDADFSCWLPPKALAGIIALLSSKAANGITGAVIPIAGRS